MSEPAKLIGIPNEPVAVDDPKLREAVTEELRRIQDSLTALTAELHAAMQMMAQCDGSHDGEPCVLTWHSGHHRTATGFEWLDK